MTNVSPFQTHSSAFDAVLGGGVPMYSLIIIAGEPGAGKTILAQQLMFDHVRKNPKSRVAYVSTLSEPTVNMVRHMQRFDFFDPDVFGRPDTQPYPFIITQEAGIVIQTGFYQREAVTGSTSRAQER